MRPIKLIITGFGPYAERTEIHMDKLGKNGLYLITGDTGAGKTTIFDAITFALYGEASGDNREPVMFRSKYALPDTPTEVELTFSYGEKIYKVKRNPEYERPALRGTGMTKQLANAELLRPDGSVLTKRRDVDFAIREIMGVDRNQFSQIAMIAQGDFLKLLFAETKERQAIFREIFQTQKFQFLQERLKEESGKLNKQCETARDSVKQYIDGILCEADNVLEMEVRKAQSGQMPVADVMNLMEQILRQDKELETHYGEEIQKIHARLADINANLGKAEEYKKIKENLAKAEQEQEENIEKLKILQETYQIEKGRQAERDEIDRELILLDAELKEYDELEQKQLELQIVEKQLEKDCKMKDHSVTELQKLMKELEEFSMEYKTYEAVGEQREKLVRETEQVENHKNTLKRLEQSLKQYEKLTDQLKQAQEAYLQVSEEAVKLKQVYEGMNQAYLDEQAGLLAERLESGMACPVCGSTTHPKLAQTSKQAPTEVQLKEAKRNAEQAELRRSEASSEAGKVNGAVTTQWEMVEKQMADLNEDSPVRQNFKMEKEENLVQNEVLKGVLHETAGLKRVITEQIIEQDTLICEYRNRIIEEEKKNSRKTELGTAIQNKEGQIQKLQPAIDKLKQSVTAAEVRQQELAGHIQGRREKLHYISKADAKGKKQVLLIKKEERIQALEKAERNYNACDKAVTERNANIQQWKQQLEDAVDIDVEQEAATKATLTEQEACLSDKHRTVHARIVANETALQKIQEKSADLTALEAKWSWVKALSNTANGNISGKEKVMLETYIQMTYFERIIARANTRLMIMSGGQYELKRRVVTDNNRSQSGLELNVIDHYNGTERSVKTLSGGESFQASLSLALGLSDEVQSSAGGIQLDTMFVDEGFGSLDEESLQQAIQALAELTKGNRLVGIISHVAELKERIDKQIVVTKEKTGGSRVEIVGI